MNKLDLQKIIREEVKKSLNETYRDPKKNLAILHAMLKKGGKDAKRAKEIIKDIKDELSIVMSTTDPKANLKLVNKVPELDEYLDDAIEMALDDGMGRMRGMSGGGGISGFMREASVKKDDLDKIGDFIMSMPQFERFSKSALTSAIKDMHSEWKKVAPHYKSIEDYFDEMEETGGEEAFMENTLTEAAGMNVTVTIPNMFAKTFKKFLAGFKQDSEKGDTYYEIAPGKEAALYSKLFSEWVKNNFNAIDEYELMDNFDSDLEISDEGGYAAVLAKNGLLAKKIK